MRLRFHYFQRTKKKKLFSQITKEKVHSTNKNSKNLVVVCIVSTITHIKFLKLKNQDAKMFLKAEINENG